MRFILRVKDKGPNVKGPRYIHTVEDDAGKVHATRKSMNRKYVACLLKPFKNGEYVAEMYFGRPDLVGRGWNSTYFKWLNKNNIPHYVVYTKEVIEQLVRRAYDDICIQAAVNEADKHATVIDKYCSGCDNYHPAFKDEEFCLICGGAHDKRKDPDLLIPLENKE